MSWCKYQKQTTNNKKEARTDLLFLDPLVTSSFICYVPKRYITTCVAIINAIKFSTPHLNDVGQSLKQDGFNAFVQLGYPIIQIGITFQIQTINLRERIKKISRLKQKIEEDGILQQLGSFQGVQRKLQLCTNRLKGLQLHEEYPYTDQLHCSSCPTKNVASI